MSDLESEIRNLNLRPPGDGLDDRVLATLQLTGSLPNPPVETQKLSPANDAARSFQSSRKGVVATSGWIVAAASMLTGIVIGRMIPPLLPHAGNENVHAALQESPANPSGPGEPGPRSATEEATTWGDSVAGGSTIGSQIVESIWLSPAAAAVVWEQQTGQIFNVVTHVGDRRFDMCRDCHRVGG